jgi:hypothetical protein
LGNKISILFGVPYKKVTFQSELEPTEIFARLDKVTTRFVWYKFPPREMDFVGRISSNKFLAYRNIRHRNTYLPWLNGKIKVDGKGSQIIVTMTLHPVAITLLLGIFFYLLHSVITSSGDPKTILLFISGAYIFHLLMYFTGFWPEVSFAEKRLNEIFTGK